MTPKWYVFTILLLINVMIHTFILIRDLTDEGKQSEGSIPVQFFNTVLSWACWVVIFLWNLGKIWK